MQIFQADSTTFSASIAVDASTIGNVTTSIGIYATRDEEIAILDSIHQAADCTGATFIPFKSKSHRFDKTDHTQFFEQVIRANESRLYGLHFQHHSANRNQHYVEGVLSAILVREMLNAVDDSPCVLIDGDTNKIDVFAGAYAGICNDDIPPVTNCYQAELYYPHALLADLTAGYLADHITSGSYDYSDPLLRVPPADQIESERWGQAFSHLQRNDPPEYERIGVDVARGDTERERAKIWYTGLMGRGPGDTRTGPSVGAIATYLRDQGYDELATRIESL